MSSPSINYHCKLPKPTGRRETISTDLIKRTHFQIAPGGEGGGGREEVFAQLLFLAPFLKMSIVYEAVNGW